jgi:hypothetical protein
MKKLYYITYGSVFQYAAQLFRALNRVLKDTTNFDGSGLVSLGMRSGSGIWKRRIQGDTYPGGGMDCNACYDYHCIMPF